MSQPNQHKNKLQIKVQPQRNAAGVFGGYSPCGLYDEFVDGHQPRPHVAAYCNALTNFGTDRINRRWQRAQQMIDESSMGLAGHLARKISASSVTQQRKKIRAWQLDAVPLLLDEKTWSQISDAVAQRATMYELLLHDLYGPQRLVREKVIPASLLHSHPGFLRAIHNKDPDSRPFLQLVAFDLARSPEGRWWFLNDRTESPSGIGFAHENRIVLSNAFPEIFQGCKVAQLSSFFDQLQSRMLDFGGRSANANGVLLGDGNSGKNYFEEAYLARAFGYTLLQGDDLTVRNDGVFFKTLGGLKKVDLIFRRRNSIDCDPLELDGMAGSGTPGLVNALRQRQVAMSNRIGSGLAESRAIMAYAARICQALLSEDLKIPNVATWWCGEAEVLPFVMENLQRLTIESAFRSRGAVGESGVELNQLSLEERKSKILANPQLYVAQERVDRSSVPVWNGDHFGSARLALRTFAVGVGAGKGFEVMKGGLGRTTDATDPLYVSTNYGEGGKDVWIQTEQPLTYGPTLSIGERTAPRRSGFELSSRSADNLFWIGRQMERIYFCACVLRSTIRRLIGEDRPGLQAEGQVLLRCLAMQGQIPLNETFAESVDSAGGIGQQLPAIVFNTSLSGSIVKAVNELLRLGQMKRNFMSLDTWRTILRIRQRTEVEQPDLQGLLSLADELVVDVSALCGLTNESMTRNQVFRFVEIGRRVEHATQLILLLRAFFVPRVEPVEPVLQTALEVADSMMTYRARYFANYQVNGVLDLLVTDETNPRSLVWQMARIEEEVSQLPGSEGQVGLSQPRLLAGSLLQSVRMSEVQSVSESWLLDDAQPMEALLNSWQQGLGEFVSAIMNRYFVHADTSIQIMQ